MAQQAAGLRPLRLGILDGLRLVENRVIETDVFQFGDVAVQRPVGGDDQIVLVELGQRVLSQQAGVVEHPEVGREGLGLLDPIEHQAAGHDRQRRGSPAVPRPLQAARLEQGQHLHRLAQPHVVGQAAAEAEVAQEVQPTESVLLIAAQLAAEPARRGAAARRRTS